MTAPLRIEQIIEEVGEMTVEDARRLGAAVADRISPNARRDLLIAEIVSHHKPGASMSAQANWLHSELLRYHEGRWRRECTMLQSPSPAQTLQAQLWQLLHLRARIPSTRQIRKLLAVCKGQRHGPC